MLKHNYLKMNISAYGSSTTKRVDGIVRLRMVICMAYLKAIAST